MISIITLILSSTTGLLSLGILTLLASYILIPAMGAIIVSFGASSSSIRGLLLIIGIVYIAAIIGDISIFFLARAFSNKFLKFLSKFKWYVRNNNKTRRLLQRYGFWIVFYSRFVVTEVCLVTNYIAGLTRFDKKKFIIAVLFGELIYAIILPVFGYLFRDTWNYLLGLLENSIWVVIVAILVAVVFKKIVKMVRKEEKLITSK